MVTENEVVLAIDSVRSMLGELKSMAHNYEALHRSRDRWKTCAEEHESELNALAVDVASSWVKLPTDTSGETIRHGDLLVDSDGVTFRVDELVLRDSGWMLRYMGDDVFPEDTIHAEKEERTVEDVLRELVYSVAGKEADGEAYAYAADDIRELLGVDE